MNNKVEVTGVLEEVSGGVGLTMYQQQGIVSIFSITEVDREPSDDIDFYGGIDTVITMRLFALEEADAEGEREAGSRANDEGIEEGESGENEADGGKVVLLISYASGLGIGNTMLEESEYMVDALTQSYSRFLDNALTKEELHACKAAVEIVRTEDDYFQFVKDNG